MEFINNHPWASVVALWLVLEFIFRIVNRIFLRLPVMLLRGFPPEHCDADGDFRPAETLKTREAGE